MKLQFRSFLSGVLVSALVLGAGVSALAISGRMTIEVDPINIQVNGETFQPKDVTGKEVPVFAYQGTTYAPVRALAEAYGLEVGYDAVTNMATVTDPDAKTEQSATPDTTANVSDYSDWSAEDEAAYQEFKGQWKLTFSEQSEDSDGPFWIYTLATNSEDTYNFANTDRYSNPYMLRLVEETAKDLTINRFRVNVDGVETGYFLYFENGELKH